MRSILMLLLDVLLAVLATVLALSLRHDFSIPMDRLAEVLPYLGYTAIVAFLAIIAFGQHRSIWRLSSSRDYQRVLVVALVIVAGATAIGFVIDRLAGVPRSLPLLQFVCTVGLMLGARAITRRVREARAARKISASMLQPPPAGARTTVLVVGLNKLTDLYIQAVSELSEGRVEIAGILGRNERQVGRQAQSLRILGVPEDLTSVLRDLEVEGIIVDRIVVAMPLAKLSEAARETLLEIGRDATISVQVLADSVGLGDEAVGPSRRNDFRALEFTTTELDLVRGHGYLRLKRVIDVVGSLTLLIIMAPIVALVALLVAIDVGVPIVFCQRRPGRWGRPVGVYKFRTMAGAYDGEGRRLSDAERCSWLGKFLRRTRLDELPQLYNVLIGDMSFVGPRPLLPKDQSSDFKARLLVRPGITGYAQVQGGRVIGAADKAAMDVWYVQNASFGLDLRIMAHTLPMMLFGERVNRGAIEQAWTDLAATGLCSTWVRSDVDDEPVATIRVRPRHAA
jgi:lipopolysaccharide/colanic/teichoic acid biosynthesis glycosyltransferase